MISVIITNYNYGVYLRDAVESVLKQTYDDFELIIVDDGSTDDSKQIIKEYENKSAVLMRTTGMVKICWHTRPNYIKNIRIAQW